MNEPPFDEPPPAPDPDSDEAFPLRDRRRSHRLRDSAVVLVLAFAAFAVGLGIFNGVVMPRLIHSTGQVQVPDLANLTLEQAERALRPTGLVLSRAGERFDPGVPRGFILGQDPAPGTPVRGRTRVSVSVSLGQEFSSVPELFGESPRSARLLLERAGLEMGAVTKAPSDEVGRDLVVTSDPPAESVLPRGTPVSLLVSTGAGAEAYVMPDLTGRELNGVRRQLEALGFRVEVAADAPSVGAIVSQSPPAGSRVTRDVTVSLVATGRIIR
jgi:beta-lactam-binding protein with PASTA domain